MPSLFHSPEFVALNGLTLIRQGSAALLLGPERGTYGGFAEAYDLQTMQELLDAAPRACTVKLAPASQDLRLFSRSMNALHRAGFMLEYADLNYDLRPQDINFAGGLSDGARKKLAKCERAGFHSRPLERKEWARAHTLIAENRRRAERTLSVAYKSLCELETARPGTHRLFGTFDAERMIAAAICVMVEPDITYIYAWGDAEKNEYAPTVQLCECIYEEAAFSGCRLLDAGISTERGVPNPGLIRFKESLGFMPSVKATMVRRA